MSCLTRLILAIVGTVAVFIAWAQFPALRDNGKVWDIEIIIPMVIAGLCYCVLMFDFGAAIEKEE